VEKSRVPAPYNVLFLCTGSSSRSIMAAAILKDRGAPNFAAYRAGSHPAGMVNSYALRQIESAGWSTAGLGSKSWNEFAEPGAPEMHFVLTLCYSAASEPCPVWPGHPLTARWGLPDPGSGGRTREELERAFRDAFATIDRRIALFLALPIASLEPLVLEREARRIGRE
jgi:arsenate reductase (thioredoxin)